MASIGRITVEIRLGKSIRKLAKLKATVDELAEMVPEWNQHEASQLKARADKVITQLLDTAEREP